MSQSLPAKPSLVYLKKQAKDLLAALNAGDAQAAETFARYFPAGQTIGLVKAQLVLAREYGFDSWKALCRNVDTPETPTSEAFIDAVLARQVDTAKEWWARYRDVLRTDPAVAAACGDVDSLSKILSESPELVRDNVAPKDRPLLCYVCCSWLVKDSEFETGILDVVKLLLAAGADPDAFHSASWGGEDWRETALYGAAGLLNHAGMTKILLDAGADPDDGSVQDDVYRGEALYHSCDHPGHYECLTLLLEANPSRVSADYCLKHMLDFEEEVGIRLFLDHGANPSANRPRTALSHAVLRGRGLGILSLLLERGADPNQRDEDGTTAYILSRRLGNDAASRLLERHGAIQEFEPHDEILIAAADGNEARVRELKEAHPDILSEFTGEGRQESDGMVLGSAGQVLHDLARLGHAKALRAVLELGADAGLKNQYNETPLHWACVAGRPDAAQVLIDFGAPLDVVEMNHHCIPIQWITWGSAYWNEPHGDYAATLEVLLQAGSALPKRFEGSPPVLAVLRAHGMSEASQ